MADYIDREQATKAAIDAVDDWDGGGNRFRAMIIKQAICEVPSADVVKESDFRDCRNELCMKCGRYLEKHLGACDGCRWESGRWSN